MTQPHTQPNQALSDLWNSRGGEVWVVQQHLLDRLFLPFERLLSDAVAASDARSILDIGCGAGATTLAAARRLAPEGRCTGLDISAPLITAARRRAETEGLTNAHFIVGDAQDHAFAPHSFDAVISRFGVMFFDEPATAFGNVQRSIRPGGRFVAVVWAELDANPWMFVPTMYAAAPLNADLTLPARGEPGPFSLADPDEGRALIETCGFRDVDVVRLERAWRFD